MKPWQSLFYGLAWALLATGFFIQAIKTHSEQRQQRIDQEIEERVNGMREECRLQYPHDIYMRVKCYQKMMANV